MTLPPRRPRPGQPLVSRLLTLAALLLLAAGIGFIWLPGDTEPLPSVPASTGGSRSPPAATRQGEAHPGPEEPASGSEPRPTDFPSDDEPLDESFLEGIVVDEDGRPVAGVKLNLYLSAPSEPGDLGSEGRLTFIHATHSGEDGTFLLESSRPGPHSVHLYHRDFLMASLPVMLPARDARLVLRRGASVEVTVLDEAGLPVADSEVQLVEGSRPGHTDDTGRVTLKALEPGRYRVVAVMPGDEPLRVVSGEVELRGQEHTSLLLRFALGQRLSGVVVDARGQPVAGAEVRAAPASLLESMLPKGELRPFFTRLHREWHSGARQPTRTGPDGRFTLKHLGPGAVVVGAHKDGYTLDERATPGLVRELETWPGVLAEPGSGEVRLVMTIQAYVRGRVVRADGSPVTRFTLDGKTHEDAQGAFRLPIRQSEERVLIFGAPGLAGTSRRLHLQEGLDTNVGEVVMDPGREVRLRVVDADTSLPVEGAIVDVRDPSETEDRMDRSLLYTYPPPSPGDTSYLLLTAEDGTVSLPHVEERPRVLLVLHCGYLMARVSLGARQRELTVALRPGGRVAGEVRVGGQASGHGGVEVLTLEGQRTASADIKGGRYRTCAMEAGRYTVQVEVHVFEDRMLPSHASQVVDVPARGTVQVHFDAPRGGAVVRVRSSPRVDQLLLLPGSHPLPVTRAEFLEAQAVAHSPMYGSEAYTFRLIPPGLYTVLAVRDSRARPVELHVEELMVPESGTLTHEFQPRWRQGPDSVSSD